MDSFERVCRDLERWCPPLYCTYLPKLVVEGSYAINNFHSIAFELNTGGLEEIQKYIGLLVS